MTTPNRATGGMLSAGGFSARDGVSGGFIPASQVMAADGAITIKNGVVFITKSSAAAITLAAPISGTDDFKTLKILSATAQAHTVTNASPGFNGGGAGSDVGTFGAAKGNGFVAVAYQGTWYVQSNVGVTFA